MTNREHAARILTRVRKKDSEKRRVRDTLLMLAKHLDDLEYQEQRRRNREMMEEIW